MVIEILIGELAILVILIPGVTTGIYFEVVGIGFITITSSFFSITIDAVGKGLELQ